MRKLTDKENELLLRRQSQLNTFLEELMPMLGYFAKVLGLNKPHMIVADPNTYIENIDLLMRDQIIREADRPWIHARLGCFIGEVMINRLGGCWFVDECPESRSFLRYVVGQFRGTDKIVDPFEAADGFLSMPAGRKLGKFIDEIEISVRSK